ncbi:MAG: 16S rRNA (cytosine(1402)-N(4))-methyltransferase RsmH [Bacilli bacterium]|nr:16S rRNA (cytosine(1402)-N(4))-methyltransferase RsmH [Bacilli bacterium]
MPSDYHKPVLLDEVIEGLNIKEDSIVVDMTLGRAGHSSSLLARCKKGHLYATDKDQTALDYSSKKLSEISSNFTLFQGDYSSFPNKLREIGITKVDCILYDIGVSSPQFDNPERGFSYRFDARLDMRMNLSQKKDAYYVVNNYSYEELKRIIYDYGEDRSAPLIAKAIVREREKKPIETTFQLVDVIKSALPSYILNKPHHPAKQTFQAIRFEVNNEREELIKGLREGIELLGIGGRLAIITFNSAEDKIVKDMFNEYAKEKSYSRHLPPVNEEKPKFTLVTRKPIVPSEEELKNNPRSAPAKLRIIERRSY